MPGWDPGPGLGGAPRPPASGSDERACAENVTRAMPVPVDLLLLVDTSGSMNQPAGGGMRTKWSLVVEAFQRFMSDPRSSGLGMGLQFMPLPAGTPCTADSDCGRDVAPPPGWPPGLPLTKISGVCREHSFCVGGTAPTDRLFRCVSGQVSCPAGATCTPGGFCAVSRRDCIDDGQPCPSGIAGDICQAGSSINVCDPRLDSCEPGDYQYPVVPVADLPGNEMLLTTAFGTRTPHGNESMGPAIKGAVTYLRKWQMDHPDRKSVLVLTTDGIPTNCPPFDISSLAAEIAAARMGTPIPTYAIGVFGAAELARGRMSLEAFAFAGGTGMPFVIDAADDVATRLQEALAEVRGLALPCEFVIPPSAGGTRLDYDKVNVKWKGASSPEETVPYVERADRCDPTRGGWYYDVLPAAGRPSRVIACEATCGQLKSDAGGTVSLTFGCATRVIE
jgi:hypothetical protein